jgi:uroporphyrinogen-III decarboxylase
MTTGMDRLRAVANGEVADRIPVFCNLIDQGAAELGMSLREYYSSGEHVAEGQLLMRAKWGYDCLWSLFYVGKEAEALGCRHIVYAEDGPPNVGEMVIRDYDAIGGLEVPDDIRGHPALAEALACTRLLKRESGGRYPVCAYITASLTLPVLLMGMQQWLELLLTGPMELRDELLAKCSAFFRQEAAAYREAGADIILYSDPFGSLDIVSRSIFEELAIPWMKRDLEHGGTDGVVYYCGGARLNAVIQRVLAETGIGTYYLSPFDDVAEAKRIVADGAVVAGVVNDIRLVDWSREEIVTEVDRILDAGMPGGRFFFGTLVMPLAIPAASIDLMLATAYEHGRARA